MVNVVASGAVKKNVFPTPPGGGGRGGSDMETWLTVTAWVANRAYVKDVWVDVHVFDGQGGCARPRPSHWPGWAPAAGAVICSGWTGGSIRASPPPRPGRRAR